MSEREILKQYGITSQPYQDWIISNLKSEDIDEQDLEILALLQNKQVATKLVDRGFSPYLDDYTWIGELVSAIDISTQRRRNPATDGVPRWAKEDETLTKIYKKGIHVKQHAYWIRKRHIKKGKILEPLDDIVPLVKIFEEDETKRLIKKYKKPPNLSDYKTIKQLNDLITELYPPALTEDFDAAVDTIGKFGEWIIYFPITMKGSMMCDPDDVTSWCTVRKGGGNLFMNYVAQPNDNTFLYYVVSTDRKRANDPKKGWFSIGVNDGEVVGVSYGNTTIDGDQSPFTEERRQKTFKKYNDDIMDTILDHYESLEGYHPVKDQLKEAAKNVRFLDEWIGKSRLEEQKDTIRLISEYPMSRDVLAFVFPKIKKDKRLQLDIMLKQSKLGSKLIGERLAKKTLRKYISQAPELLLKALENYDPKKRKRVMKVTQRHNYDNDVEFLSKCYILFLNVEKEDYVLDEYDVETFWELIFLSQKKLSYRKKIPVEDLNPNVKKEIWLQTPSKIKKSIKDTPISYFFGDSKLKGLTKGILRNVREWTGNRNIDMSRFWETYELAQDKINFNALSKRMLKEWGKGSLEYRIKTMPTIDYMMEVLVDQKLLELSLNENLKFMLDNMDAIIGANDEFYDFRDKVENLFWNQEGIQEPIEILAELVPLAYLYVKNKNLFIEDYKYYLNFHPAELGYPEMKEEIINNYKKQNVEFVDKLEEDENVTIKGLKVDDGWLRMTFLEQPEKWNYDFETQLYGQLARETQELIDNQVFKELGYLHAKRALASFLSAKFFIESLEKYYKPEGVVWEQWKEGIEDWIDDLESE